VSGRKMIDARIAGETDPATLARLADRRVKASQQMLQEALRGRVTNSHRFLLRLHLGHIDALDAGIAELDREVEAGIAPFRTAVEQVATTPGVKSLAARTILSEIGTDMSRFPTSGHLISWACICPRNDESAGRRRSTRIRKGSPWLKATLVQCAWAATRTKGYVPPRSIPPHPSAAWAEAGHPGRRGVDTYRHLSHAQGRNPL
jgi:transposase